MPCSGIPSSCSLPTRRASPVPRNTGARARPGASQAACASSSTPASRDPARSSCCSPRARMRSSTRLSGARACRRIARPAGATSASSRSSTCSRTAAPAQSLRRRRARHGARLAVRRCLERLARAPAAQRATSSAVHGTGAGLPEQLDAGDERLLRAFLQRYERWFARRRGSGSRRCARGSSASTTTTSPFWRAGMGLADSRTSGSSVDWRATTSPCAARTSRASCASCATRTRSGRRSSGGRRRGGGGAVRLLTIHAAKGLEFKVVIVADAGRDVGGPRGPDEIVALSDGRFGFRMVHPTRGDRRGVFAWDAVKEAAGEEERVRAPSPVLRRDDTCDRPPHRLGSDRPDPDS